MQCFGQSISVVDFCYKKMLNKRLCNRSGSCHGDACDHLLDDTGDCNCLATKHFPSCMLSPLFWIYRSCVHLRIFDQSSRGRVGTTGALCCFYEHHVHLALWNVQKVWVWLAEQSLHEVDTYPWSKSGYCPGTGDWSHLHGACNWCACHIFAFCHQLASISSSSGLCLYQIGTSPLCSSARALSYWTNWTEGLSYVQVRASSLVSLTRLYLRKQ